MCSSQPLSNTILKYIAFSHPSAGAIEHLSGLTELCWCHRNGAIRVVETWGGVFCPKHVWEPYGKGGDTNGKGGGHPWERWRMPWERWDPHGAARRCPPAGVCRVGISGALQWRNYGEHQIPASRGEPRLSGFPQVPAALCPPAPLTHSVDRPPQLRGHTRGAWSGRGRGRLTSPPP